MIYPSLPLHLAGPPDDHHRPHVTVKRKFIGDGFIVCTSSSLYIGPKEWSCDESLFTLNLWFWQWLATVNLWCSFKLKKNPKTTQIRSSSFVRRWELQFCELLTLVEVLDYLRSRPCCCWRRIMMPRSWRIDECLWKVSFMCRSKSYFSPPIQCRQWEGALCWTYGLVLSFCRQSGSITLEFALGVLAL